MTPSVSILQISDLHRERLSPIRNDVLLSSLQNDLDRYVVGRDGPDIRSPDIIVVSGDVIRGVVPSTVNYETKLAEQYNEAMGFLDALTRSFLAGDRDRLVLVPGNHDVSACHFLQSLEQIELKPENKDHLLAQLFQHGSKLRWSWKELELFRVADETLYAQRFAPFALFYAEFYHSNRVFDLDPSKQFGIFDYPEFNLTLAGYSSCMNLECPLLMLELVFWKTKVLSGVR